MADDTPLNRETVDKLVAELFVQIGQLKRLHPRTKTILQDSIRAFREALFARIRTGALTQANWPKIEETLRNLAVPSGRGSPGARAWREFAERLASRQGTHIPDWEQFYAERESLERSICNRDQS